MLRTLLLLLCAAFLLLTTATGLTRAQDATIPEARLLQVAPGLDRSTHVIHAGNGIPATNPFTDTAGYRPEIWALGLRNPWRLSFDDATADLYIVDVGQSTREEVNYQPAGGGGGNYGWNIVDTPASL